MMYPEFQRMLEFVRQGPGGEPEVALFAPERDWQPDVRTLETAATRSCADFVPCDLDTLWGIFCDGVRV